MIGLGPEWFVGQTREGDASVLVDGRIPPGATPVAAGYSSQADRWNS
jgi:hypothetical protein